jgi:hypothetical protein
MARSEHVAAYKYVVKAPSRPTSRFGKATWHLHNPAAAVVLLLLLGTLSPSVFKLFIPEAYRSDWLVPPPGKMGYSNSYRGWLVSAGCAMIRSGSGQPFVLVGDDQTSQDELSKACQQHPQDVLNAYCQSTVAKRGFWSPTRVEGDRRIVLEGRTLGPFNPMTDPATWPRYTFAPEELAQARETYLQYIMDIDSEFASPLMSGDQHVLRRLPVGILLNIAASGVLILLLFSLVGVRRYMKLARVDDRLWRGLCGLCLYDLKGIEPTGDGTRCPECGAVWETRAVGRAPWWRVPLMKVLVADRSRDR